MNILFIIWIISCVVWLYFLVRTIIDCIKQDTDSNHIIGMWISMLPPVILGMILAILLNKG